MKHLFITDMDGTLLGPDSRVSPESAAIITGLSRRGALITVATARTPATVEPLLHDTLTTIPAIVLTGAAMWDRSSMSFMDPLVLTAEKSISLEAAFRGHGISPFVYKLCPHGHMEVLHDNGMTVHEQKFYSARSSLDLKKFIFSDPPHCTDATADPTVLMLGIGPTDRINSLASQLRSDPGLSISAYPDLFTPDLSYIEVFRAGVSKAAAVLRLKEMLGADRVTVYGDHLNDLPMFAVADESVAVANALPEVLEAATRVIGPNTLPSVALDIASHFPTDSNLQI